METETPTVTWLWVGGLLKGLIWGVCLSDTGHMLSPVALKPLLHLNDLWNLIKYKGPGSSATLKSLGFFVLLVVLQVIPKHTRV